MAIKVACTCGAHFTVKDEWAGRRAKCRGCQAVVTIPSPGTPGRSEGPADDDSAGTMGQSPDSDAFSDLFNEELPVAAASPTVGVGAPGSKPAKQRRATPRTAKPSSRRRKISAGTVVKLALALGAVYLSWRAVSEVLQQLGVTSPPGNSRSIRGQSSHESSSVRRTRTVDDLVPAENVSRMVGGPGGEKKIEGAYGFIGAPMSQQKVTGVVYGVGEWKGRKTFTTFLPLFGRSRSAFRGAKVVAARDGYAVGGIIVNADEIVHAVKLIFMRVADDDGLDPSDSYTSDWLGHPSGESEEEINGRGRPVVGFMVRRMAAVDAVGLIYD